MKISLALGNRRELSPQTAWGCLTTNLVMPGFGSLVAGRRVGYVQAVFYLASFGVTLIAGSRFVVWSLVNWSRLHSPQADQVASLAETWRAARWPLAGILGFVVSSLWALGTSWSILHEAKKAQSGRVPPRL